MQNLTFNSDSTRVGHHRWAQSEDSGLHQHSLCSFIDGRPLLVCWLLCSARQNSAMHWSAMLCSANPYCAVYSPLICPNSHPADIHHSPRTQYVCSSFPNTAAPVSNIALQMVLCLQLATFSKTHYCIAVTELLC